MPTLTPRQKQVLDFVKSYRKKRDYSPSLEEIAVHLGVSSVATVHEHLSNLTAKGLVQREENQPRAIEIGATEPMIQIPLIGMITAGQPIISYETNESISISKNSISRPGEHYALKVAGESMIGEGIFDGDVVVVKKQSSAQNGETVVALINNDEVTLKKIYKEKGRFRLQPANPKMKPIYVKNVTIQGKVVNVVRNLVTPEREKELSDKTIEYIKTTDIRHRKSLGQYFTPRTLREALLSKLPKIKNPKILDPASGTGEFLITAKKYFGNSQLHGWEIDKRLVKISQELIPGANFKNTNSLKMNDEEKFDFIIGNPPYFEFKPSQEIEKQYQESISGRVNIYGLFIYKGIKLLKDGGYMAFIVPPSMNNGAYFSKLRRFIVENCNIEYLSIQKTPTLFDDALQSVMLLILKKGKNKGDYVFKKNGILIFSEEVNLLEQTFKNSITLHDVGYEVKTGRLVWNENKAFLTDNPENSIPIIWSHNITNNGLQLNNNHKPQFVRKREHDVGPVIVVNRIIGHPGKGKLRAALIPSGMKFIAENHVNVIYPPKQQKFGIKTMNINTILEQLNKLRNVNILQSITGNTQISKNELEKLFPIRI